MKFEEMTKEQDSAERKWIEPSHIGSRAPGPLGGGRGAGNEERDCRDEERK